MSFETSSPHEKGIQEKGPSTPFPPLPGKLFFDWSPALYLAERRRLASLAEGEPAPSSRLRRWREQAPFGEPGILAERLAEDALDEASFARLLALPAAAIADPEAAPAWATRLVALYCSPSLGEDAGDDPVAVLLAPLLRDAEKRLAQDLAAIFAPGARLAADFGTLLPSLIEELGNRLERECRRTVVLELHASRELGLLAGGTGAERLRDFCRRLATPQGAGELFASFPLLGRRLVEQQQLFLAATVEMCLRLEADVRFWSALLPEGGEPVLTGVEGGLSDPHRGGRGVHFLRFAGGRRVVYKPKNLGAELAFASLLGWLAKKGLGIDLRALRVADRGDYGWAELVERGEVADRGELREFYRRQGAFLALLHALQAVDFHHENLIAAGAFPVLIDLECLFHPQIDGVAGSVAVGSTSIDAYLDTVHAIGFLPQRIWDGDGSDGLDISGLGASSGRKTPQPVPRLVGQGGDELGFASEVLPLPDPVSLPRWAGGEPRVEEHTDDLLAGFAETYRFLVRHRDELLAPDGPVAAFAVVEQRVLLRATHSYVTLLEASSHPHVLGDALDADLLLDRLWSVLEPRPWLRPVLRDERAALLRGDVPLFTLRPGSRELSSCSGRRHPAFFAETGLERVARRIALMGEEDLEKQSRIVRGTLGSVALARQPRFFRQHRLDELPEPAGLEGKLLEEASLIALHLEQLEVRRAEGSFFFAQKPVGRAYSYDPIGFDLYRGQAGIALFHAQLFAATGQGRHAAAARRTLQPVVAALEVSPLLLPSVGAFGGWAGVGYALERIAALLGDPALAIAASRIPEKIAALLPGDRTYDLLGGAAGAVLYLLSRHRRHGETHSLELATAAGDQLLAAARKEPQGWGWGPAGAAPLAGLSHGSGGVAWALLELASASGQPRYAAAAAEALRYERSLFRPTEGNWADLRPASPAAEEENFLCAWCHGAVGIGLARLLSLPHLEGMDREAADSEIGVAIETALRDGFGASHCLCHGDLGTLDFLLEAAHRRRDPALAARVRRLAAGLLESLRKEGWRCGLASDVEQPGLFLGYAGVGYGLLRLARPSEVPSLLAFGWDE